MNILALLLWLALLIGISIPAARRAERRWSKIGAVLTVIALLFAPFVCAWIAVELSGGGRLDVAIATLVGASLILPLLAFPALRDTAPKP